MIVTKVLPMAGRLLSKTRLNKKGAKKKRRKKGAKKNRHREKVSSHLFRNNKYAFESPNKVNYLLINYLLIIYLLINLFNSTN